MRGVGIGWRPEIAADLFAQHAAADFLEVTAEACALPSARREAIAIAEVWPIVTHGVKLSLGSAEGLDLERARKLASVARDVRSEIVTEHVAFVRAGGREIGHLTQLPMTREVVRVVARNTAAARRVLPDVPFLLENVAWSFRWPDDEMEEGAFYTEIADATGCGLLLDVGNLYANAVNAGRDPVAVLETFPLDRVGMLHIAGGIFEDGFYFDTHAHPIDETVFALIEATLARVGDVPVVLERDTHFPRFEVLAAELSRTRALPFGTATVRERKRGPLADARGAETHAFAAKQAQVATMLTSVEAPREVGAFDAIAIARARGILERKRVDDALPLLPSLARRADTHAIALRCVRSTPRPASGVAIADALAIADAAAEVAALADDARKDRLMLRARFVRQSGILRPRAMPFVGRERLGHASLWAIKGPGASAPVRTMLREEA